MINDFDDTEEGDFDDFAVAAFHLDARSGKSLRCFHTADDAAHARAVFRNNLYVIFAVERSERRESFGDFHCLLPRFLIFGLIEKLRDERNATSRRASMCRVSG